MLRFQHQEYFIFILLLFVAVIAYIFYLAQRKKKIEKLGDVDLVENLMPSYNRKLRNTKFVILAIALLFGIIGLANLQKSGEVQKINQKGIDVVIALDVSNSMLAQDIKPNRLEKAKLFSTKLIDELANNRLAFVLFAGRPYLSVPLTSDIEALKMNLGLAHPDQLPTQGTILSEALKLAEQSFNSKDPKHKAIVLITDGEDHEEKAIKEAKRLAEKGIMLCTVGVGSNQGGKIPLGDNQGYKTDNDGQEILSKMNASELQEIAKAGNGIFIRLNNISTSLKELKNQLDQITKTNLGDSRFTNYSSYFQYFLFIMLLLLVIEFFIPSTNKHTTLKAFSLFIIIALLPNATQAQNVQSKNIFQGNELYKKGQYDDAISMYKKALEEKEKESKRIAQFNLGNALFKSNNKEEALKNYDLIGLKDKNKTTSAAAYHNAGNVKASDKKWQEAINYYKASLKKNPQSQATKYNLAYAQQKLKEQQNQKKKDKKKDKKEQKKKEEEQQQKEQDKSEKQKKEQQKKKEEEQEKKEQQKTKAQPSKISQQQADKILDALSREEKKVKDKKEKKKGRGRPLLKDW